MTISTPAFVEISPEVLFQKLNDGSVLLDLVSEQYIGLDAVATSIWQLLTEDGDTERVVAKMLEKYEVDEERLRSDLALFIEQLHAQGLAKLEPVVQ
jgi:hypothetical protein